MFLLSIFMSIIDAIISFISQFISWVFQIVVNLPAISILALAGIGMAVLLPTRAIEGLVAWSFINPQMVVPFIAVCIVSGLAFLSTLSVE